MRLQYIKRVDLLQVYSEASLPFMTREFGNRNIARTSLIDEEIPVTLLRKYGKFSLVSFDALNDVRTNAGLIVPSELVLEKSIPEAIEAYTPVLDELHKGHWHYDPASQNLFIHYPEITIKNSMGMEHKITDLVVLICVTGNYRIGSGLSGFRTTFTDKELRRRYIHSHLNVGHYDITGFCLGSSVFASYLQMSNGKFITPTEFGMLLYQVRKYIEWESLDGMPFISIKDMYTNSLNEVTNNVGISDLVLPSTTRTNLNVNTAREWEKIVAAATMMLIEDPKYSNLLVSSGYGYILQTMGNTPLKEWEDEVTAKFFSSKATFQARTAEYSVENRAYMLGNGSQQGGSYRWSDVESYIKGIPESWGVKDLFEKIGCPKPTLLPEPEETKKTEVKLVRRLNTPIIQNLIRDVNTLLLNGLKNELNERIDGSTQSESNNNTAAGVPGSVSPQPVLA